MIADAKHAELYCEWLDYIENHETKDACRFFVGLAASLKYLECYPVQKGTVKDFRFFDTKGEQPFAFIPNKQWLLFYFRLPAIRSGHYVLEIVRSKFDPVNVNTKGEWTLKLTNIADVQRLWALVGIE